VLLYLTASFGGPVIVCHFLKRCVPTGKDAGIFFFVGFLCMCILAYPAFGLCMVLVSTTQYLIELYGRASIWRRIRAFEAIAAERPPEGVV
jgi:hypothetical protein